MRFLRYLLYLVLQLGFLGGLFWLYTLIRGTSVLHFNFFSSGLLTLLAVSIVPYVELLRRQRRLPLAHMRAIRSLPFILRCTFRGCVRGTVSEVREVLREICNGTVLTDRVLALENETEDSLEYVAEARIGTVGARTKRKRFEATRLEIHLSSGEEATSTNLELVSTSDERDVGIDNIANEENVGAIVLGLMRAGLLCGAAGTSADRIADGRLHKRSGS